MNKKESLWKMDAQGGLVFPLRDRLLRNAYAPDSGWERPAAAILVMLVCAVLDFVVFKQLFAAILYDQLLIQWLSVVGCLVAFDLAPVYAGILWKKSRQGLKSDVFSLAALLGAFLLVLAGSVWLRITVKDVLVPPGTAAAFSIFGQSGTQGSDPAALPYAVFSGALPLATSAVSFIVSCMSSDPLGAGLKALRSRQVQLEAAIGQLRALLAEFDAEQDLQARLAREDEEAFRQTAVTIRELGFTCAD